MEHPLTAHWGVRISSADLNRLRKGFAPQSMDDKWVCSADNSEPGGTTTTVHLSRSWTGREQFTLKVKSDERGAEITDIIWNRGKSEDPVEEKEAKEQATNLCRNLMGCEWSTRS